ncbi:MAG: hypothetical protein KY445_09860 [Armatimonadetes bacterium]|nr:hypothetical protein [Armatimonadota bacterium]
MAVTFDFGQCAACGDNNSKTLQQCRSCGAALSWAKPVKIPAANFGAPGASPSNPGPQNAPAKPKIGLGDIAYGAMAVQLLGGFLFVAGLFLWCGNRFHFFPTFPFAGHITAIIGAVMWRFGSEMN